MAEPELREGDMVILQEDRGCLLLQYKGGKDFQTVGNERRPELALARLTVDAVQDRVAVWLTRDGTRHELLVSFRTIPPQGLRAN